MRGIVRGISATLLAVGGMVLWNAAEASGAGTASHLGRSDAAVEPAPSAAFTGKSAGPFVTLLFSRTEVDTAINCVPDGRGVVPLPTVARYLASRGMAGTGTLVTSWIRETQRTCTHEDTSLMGSWSDARQLATNFGWRFVSHTATYPERKFDSLPPQRQRAETCGSAHAIDAHGLLGGHGLIAYPGGYGVPTAAQSAYGSKCFAWGRLYGFPGITKAAAAKTRPYWQQTVAADGGACNQASAKCHRIKASGRGPGDYYELPADFIAQVKSLHSGEWMTIQTYILVSGKSPAGTAQKWDCTSPNVLLHWTTDNERYCYQDYQQIVNAVATSKIRVTDPLSVGIAFGRPATYN